MLKARFGLGHFLTHFGTHMLDFNVYDPMHTLPTTDSLHSNSFAMMDDVNLLQRTQNTQKIM